jgi:hypothetical protein
LHGENRTALHIAFRHVAHELTSPVEVPVHQTARQGAGGDGHRLTTAAVADSYIQLCHDPLKDLHRWIDETRPGTTSEAIPLYQETSHVIQCASVMEDSRGIRSDALHQVQSRMDADRPQRIDHVLSARSATGTVRYDQLRSLSAERREEISSTSDNAAAGLGEFASELSAVNSYYMARMAAARSSLRPGDVGAAIRALQGEQTLALRAVLERWSVSARHHTQRKQKYRAAHQQSSMSCKLEIP